MGSVNDMFIGHLEDVFNERDEKAIKHRANRLRQQHLNQISESIPYKEEAISLLHFLSGSYFAELESYMNIAHTCLDQSITLLREAKNNPLEIDKALRYAEKARSIKEQSEAFFHYATFLQACEEALKSIITPKKIDGTKVGSRYHRPINPYQLKN